MGNKPTKVLAVDDNQDNLTTIKALVREAFPAIQTLTATNGKAGIALARAEDPDVILLDILMPGMDGFAVCRELKAHEVLRDIPVVFVTALKADKENRIRALEAGAEGFICKPIDESELTAQIRAMTKIKAAHAWEREEKERLAALVRERTAELNIELDQRKKANDRILRNQERLESLVDIHQHDAQDIQRFLDYALNEAIRISESTIGYIYYYNEESSEFSLNTWSTDVMKECAVVNPLTRYHLEKTGIWGEVVRQRKPIVINDFTIDNPLKKGYPSGHVHLNNFCTVPVFHEKKIVAVVGVANKASDYDQSDVLQLTLLMDAVWKVTSRKQAEQSQRESEDRYRRITEGITDYLYTVRIEHGRAVETKHSPACEKVTGYTAGEFAADLDLWITMVPDDDRQNVIVHIGDILSGKQVAPIEHRIRRKNGEICWVSDAAILHKDNQGNLLSYEGVVKDITERKELEKTQTFLLQAGQPGSGQDFFAALARYLSEALGMEYVCIDRLDGDGLTAQTVAIYNDGTFDTNTVYALKDTPCGDVVGKIVCCYPDNVCRRFPRDAALLDLKAESYIGVTLWSYNGKPIGLIAVIGRKALKNPTLAEGILKLVSVRAAGELERKAGEDELRKSQQMYRQLVNSIPDTSILLLDRDLRYQIVGGGEVEKSGFDKSKIIHQTLRDAYPKEVADLFEPLFRKALQGESTSFEMPYLDSHYLQQVLPMRGVDGNIFGTMQIATNITARKRAENDLRQSEEKFSRAFQIAPYAITITLAEDGRFVEVNDAFLTMAGVSRNEALAGSSIGLNMWVNEADRQTVMDDLYAGRAVVGREYRFRVRSDTIITGLFSAQIITLNKCRCVLSSINDITEKRLIESRLRQSEKMEAIGQLAGGIAHDFNNILAGILGYTDMSLEFAEEGSVLEKNLRRVLQASERAKHLVKQILTFSRQRVQQKSITAILPIIKEVLELLGASIPSSVIIESDLSNDTKPVLADSTQIHEMILNIVTNAVHAMGRKGTLIVRLHAVALDRAVYGRAGKIEPGEYVVIEIADSGCGMDTQTLAKAFDPFFTTKAVGEGTGMGLSVVLGVVQSHGGDLQVESAPGAGTTFRIFLPVAATFEPAGADTDASSPRGGAERILFVDDEKVLVEMAEELLGSLGYQVTGMSSSRDALKFIEEKSAAIDLIITDQTMPHLTGVELAKAAIKIRKDLPVILCSGYNIEINPERAAAIGISRLVMKPIKNREITTIVREVLDKKCKGEIYGANTGD
jgi:PAS domain S-box-containing protein